MLGSVWGYLNFETYNCSGLNFQHKIHSFMLGSKLPTVLWECCSAETDFSKSLLPTDCICNLQCISFYQSESSCTKSVVLKRKVPTRRAHGREAGVGGGRQPDPRDEESQQPQRQVKMLSGSLEHMEPSIHDEYLSGWIGGMILQQIQQTFTGS